MRERKTWGYRTGSGYRNREEELTTSGNCMPPFRFNPFILSTLASPGKGKHIPGTGKYLQNIHSPVVATLQTKIIHCSFIPSCPVPRQTVLLLPDVLTDSSMPQLGLRFAALPYLSIFGPYWNGRTPFTCLSFSYFFARLPVSVCLSSAWVT